LRNIEREIRIKEKTSHPDAGISGKME